MNKKKWIKEIIGETVEKRGFEYKGLEVDGFLEGYSYERKEGDLRQYISITVSDGVRMTLNTNAYRQIWVSVTELIKPKFDFDLGGFIDYRSEEEFKEILYYFRDVLVEKGFAVLEEKSKPTTEVRPKKETYWELYTEHEELNKTYCEKYGLDETGSIRKLVKKISDIILGTKEQKFSEVEEMLVGLAAVYGSRLIKKRGGEWKWNEEHCSCIIDDMWSDIYKCECANNPLVEMISYWENGKEDMDRLLQEFKQFWNEEIF